MHRISIVILCVMLGSLMRAQRTFKVVEWNVENLFDCRHDTLQNDYDFLPEGKYHWTPFRYWKKVNEVGQVLTAIGGDEGLPALVGLCEVENDSVLFDLTRRSVLKNAGYEYVMTHSADHRGVDVALLYQPALFRVIGTHSVRIPSVEHGYSPTRDLLYTKGMLLTGDTLHLIVCHLPSKAGGGQGATRHRRLAAETLAGIVDSVLALDVQARLLVMGDFNAASHEKIFNPLLPPLNETLPTSRSQLSKPVGTYYYQRQWSYLDHILVSDGFLHWQQEARQQTGELRACEVRLPFLLDNEGTPCRTYRGPSYNGGISDHLPLCLEVVLPSRIP